MEQVHLHCASDGSAAQIGVPISSALIFCLLLIGTLLYFRYSDRRQKPRKELPRLREPPAEFISQSQAEDIFRSITGYMTTESEAEQHFKEHGHPNEPPHAPNA